MTYRKGEIQPKDIESVKKKEHFVGGVRDEWIDKMLVKSVFGSVLRFRGVNVHSSINFFLLPSSVSSLPLFRLLFYIFTVVSF